MPVMRYVNLERYNNSWWRDEQLPRKDENWEAPSKGKPWYGCMTKNKIAQDPLSGFYYIEHGTGKDMILYVSNYYKYHGYSVELRQTTRTGYMQPDSFAVLPYLGQWGKGWIIAEGTPAKSYVDVTYILLFGGVSNG